MIDSRDVASAVIHILEKDLWGEDWIVSNLEELRLFELYKAANIKPPFFCFLPPAASRSIRAIIKGYQFNNEAFFSSKKIRTAGWEPSVTLDETLNYAGLLD